MKKLRYAGLLLSFGVLMGGCSEYQYDKENKAIEAYAQEKMSQEMQDWGKVYSFKLRDAVQYMTVEDINKANRQDFVRNKIIEEFDLFLDYSYNNIPPIVTSADEDFFQQLFTYRMNNEKMVISLKQYLKTSEESYYQDFLSYYEKFLELQKEILTEYEKAGMDIY